jgi:hypothetical protein
MKTLKSMRVPLLAAGIAAILFSTLAIAHVPITRWFQSTFGADAAVAQESAAEASAALQDDLPVPAAAPATARCEDCGIIQSVRTVAAAGKSPAIYEVTVRMGNGTTHVLSDEHPANWHRGERIKLIGGRNRLVR